MKIQVRVRPFFTMGYLPMAVGHFYNLVILKSPDVLQIVEY